MEKIMPMLLGIREKAFDSGEFLFEVKLDGIRIIADGRKKDKAYELYSRAGTDYTEKFSVIADEIFDRFGGGFVFDGEAVLLDEKGKPDFYGLLSISGKRWRSEKDADGNFKRLFYFVFDVLFVKGESVERLTLRERKSFLNEIFSASFKLERSAADRRVVKTDVFDGGVALFEAARKEGLEGIVAKRLDSVYEQGQRSGKWLKIKVRQEIEAWIVGYKVQSRLSICLALKAADGKLHYAGNAGTGLDEREFARLQEVLEGLRCLALQTEVIGDFGSDVVRVEPKIKVLVSFTEKLEGGRLRNPVIERIT